MSDQQASSSAAATLKPCDTIPAPQNLAVRVGTRQLDGLRHHHDPVSTPSDASADRITGAFIAASAAQSSIGSHTRKAQIDSDDPLPPTKDIAVASTSSGSNNLIGPVGKIATPTPVSPARHLCMRHKRTADEGTNLKLGQSLNALPIGDRQMINALWSMFSSSPHANRAIILQGLLTMCCSSQLSLLSEQVPQLLRIDPFFVFPREISLRVLKYLDATSLARAAQVSRCWRSLADDDLLWRNMCEQHIGGKCPTCGWGLPVLEKKRRRSAGSASPSVRPIQQRPPLVRPMTSASSIASSSSSSVATLKRRSPFGDEDPNSESQSSQDCKRRKTADETCPSSATSSPSSPQRLSISGFDGAHSFPHDLQQQTASLSITRPWKDVYSERLRIERNWRRGRYSVTTLKGHTDGVMCLQLNETLSHPSFPVLISGSYDRTVRVWNLETGQTVRVLTGHTRAVRALQFDEVKLITASMDRTLRVWNWRTGVCVRVLEGHSEGVVSLVFDADVLASGSVDTTVKVWNLRKGDCFTLRGHEDWVNAVKIWDPNASHHSPSSTSSSSDPDIASYSSSSVAKNTRARSPLAAEMSVDLTGKMLFSASDDCTIRLWDLGTRACVREFRGHVGQVQSIKMIYSDRETERARARRIGNGASTPSSSHLLSRSSSSDAQLRSGTTSRASRSPIRPGEDATMHSAEDADSAAKAKDDASRPRPLLISGSLDNTLKLWDVESGQDLQTSFGHIEGVWAVASDKLRIVSASHDRTIKIWDRESDKSSHTLVGHRGAVTCLDLADDKIVSGSDDCEIRVWSFAPAPAADPHAMC